MIAVSRASEVDELSVVAFVIVSRSVNMWSCLEERFALGAMEQQHIYSLMSLEFFADRFCDRH